MGNEQPADYPIKGRGGKGIKTANVTEKNGPLAGIAAVTGEEDILLITDTGVLIRFKVANVSQTGRATLGVRLIRVDDEAKVATMAKVEAEPDEPETQTATTEPTVPTENVTDTGLAQVDDLLARAEENQNEPNND
jgi:DNA gyrase subunit A